MLTDSEIRLDLALFKDDVRRSHDQVQADLSQIVRYPGLEMTHPSNVANHQRLVTHIAHSAASIWSETMGISVDIQPSTVLRMSRHHDDHEADPLIGDIPTSLKEVMTEDEVISLKEREVQANLRLAKFYGLAEGSVEYQQFLKEKHDLDTLATPEAECTKAADLLHATWEVFHECLSGNVSFLPVAERYRARSAKLAERSPIWNTLRHHPDIQLDDAHFPTPEQLLRMPRITKTQVDTVDAEVYETWEEFENIMNNPNFPVWYRKGFEITSLEFGIHNLAQVIFPTWKKSFYTDA
jgi:5'-deoxynucleotidase YfbR-like HD superfamily hydrolase